MSMKKIAWLAAVAAADVGSTLQVAQDKNVKRPGII
jgi:hypothetical protein